MPAAATVSSTLVADTYNVIDGGRTYAVLDVYVTGTSLGDVMGGSVTGLAGGANPHAVIFATSGATGADLTRDSAGRLTAGTITGDLFVQSGGSGWLPTNTDGKGWDSFIAVGNRGQGTMAKVTNRASVLKDQGLAANMSAASGFSQMTVANSNYIDNGLSSGWFSGLGGNPYTTATTSENPFARVSLYNADWDATYPDLARSGMLVSKGKMQSGRATAGDAASFSGGEAGTSLNFCWMVGRFAIDITDRDRNNLPTMQVQFNMVGRNGSAAEAGTLFTGSGATTGRYRVSQFFSFTPPPAPAPGSLVASKGTSTTGVDLSWNASAGATRYKIFRGIGAASDDITPVDPAITGTRFTDTTAASGTVYTYAVKAVGGVGASDSDPSNTDTGYVGLSAPAGFSASDGDSAAGVNLAWTATDGAIRYKIFRGIGVADNDITPVSPDITGTTFADTTAVAGTVYTYAVKAVGESGVDDSPASNSDTGSRGSSAVPTPTSFLASSGASTGGVNLSWNVSVGATRYRIFRGIGSASTEITPASPDITQTSFTDTTAVPGTLYTYAVKAGGGPGVSDSEASNTSAGYRALSAPASMAVSQGTSTAAANLSWAPSVGATRYKIFRGIGAASVDITPASPAITGTTFSDTSADQGTVYTYAVKAVGEPGIDDSAASATATGYRGRIAPTPTSFTASRGASTSGVNLAWSAAVGATRYKIFRGIGSASTDITPATPFITGTSFTDTSAVPGTLYTYAVRAVGGASVSDSEISSSSTGYRALSAPTSVSATNGSSISNVTVTWIAATGAVRYKVFRGIGAASTDITPASPLITGTTFVDSTAVQGTIYTYAVKTVGVDGINDSALSNSDTGYREVSATTPTGFAASDGGSTTGVKLVWTASSGAVRYKVFRGIGSASTEITPASPAITSNTFTDTTAVAGTRYTYAVKAVGAAGVRDSEASTSDTGYRALTAVSSIAATKGTSASGVTLTWGKPPTGAPRYKIFRALGSVSVGAVTTDITPASPAITGTTFTDTTAEPGTLYTYVVRAAGDAGVSDGPAYASDKGYRALGAPTSVLATGGTSTGGVTVTWAASTGAASYKIFRGVGSASAQIGSVTAPALTFTDTTAVPGTIYTYAVKAAGATGVADSAASATASGYRAFSAPTSVAATDGASTANVTVTWAASTGAKGYKVFRAVGSAAATQIGTTTTALTFSDTTGVPGTLYNYSVRATGAAGMAESAASVANSGYRALSAPTSLAASDGTSSANVTVTWVASTGASSYKIFRGATLAGTVSAPTTTFADTGAVAGTVYSYTVKAAGPTGVSDSVASTANTGWRNLAAPTGLIASDNLTSRITVNWSAVPGATGYKLYRGTSAGSLTMIAALTALTFNDTTAAVGTTYIYAVTARSNPGESVRSATDTGVRVAGLMTADSSKPTDPGDGSYSRNSTEAVTEEAEIAPMGVQRYLQVIAIRRDAAQACDAEADAQTTPGDTTEGEATDGENTDPTDAPAIIDLDQNGEPDLCQLRRGDLDLNGRMDEADLALLLTMIGEEPVLGFGDLNGDGVIDGGDVQVLSERMDPAIQSP
jgi:fibronectin type 3 domain-containing protein